MEEYEMLHGNEINFNDSFLHAHKEFILIRIGGTTADKAGFREYNYTS
jgi:hydroxymethylglutaryl-CoA synthase